MPKTTSKTTSENHIAISRQNYKNVSKKYMMSGYKYLFIA